MHDSVTMRAEGGVILLNAEGIALRAWFTRRPVKIPWSNILLISPTPAVRNDGDAWATYRGEPLNSKSLSNGLRFYCFDIAIRDMGSIVKPLGFFQRACFVRAFWPRPFDKTEHFISVSFPARWLRRNGESLVNALKIISRYSRFDLIVFDCEHRGQLDGGPALTAPLPPLFRPLVDPKRLGAAPVTLAVFPATSSAVVTANVARRLLVRLGDAPAPWVVVGYNFTQDTVEVLQDAGATLFAVSSFWWTDARWQAIRRR